LACFVSRCDWSSIQPASQVCTECAWNAEGWLCEACAVAHECGDEMCLPIAKVWDDSPIRSRPNFPVLLGLSLGPLRHCGLQGKEATLPIDLDVRYASRFVTNLRYAVQASEQHGRSMKISALVTMICNSGELALQLPIRPGPQDRLKAPWNRDLNIEVRGGK
jgi:hypothetical protein